MSDPKKKKKTKDNGTVQLGLQVPTEMKKLLQVAAQDQVRSLSGQVISYCIRGLRADGLMSESHNKTVE